MVYSIMSLFVIGIYVAVVTGVGSQVPGHAGWFSLLATGIVAITIQPVREACQRAVDRLFFGQRAEPYAVVSHLGDQLEGVAAHEAAVTAIVETVAQALKLPFVEIKLDLLDGSCFIARTGREADIDGSWPLLHQLERIGTLAVSPRSPDERLSGAERQLLSDIARQAGTVLGAIRATEALKLSHARLVAAREEERRRLHRDLHDGLAPNLASQSLTLDAARTLMHTDAATANRLLDSLELHLQASMEEVRRIIYGLRPSALDNLGLAGALAACERARHSDAAAIEVDTNGRTHPLPAAVEVAAYWIAREALTNMDRHSQATHCTVRATIDAEETRFCLVIDDNGHGISETPSPGVGSGVHARTCERAWGDLHGGMPNDRGHAGPGSAAADVGDGMTTIRVAIIDDHPVFRFGVQALLLATPDLVFAGEASTGAEAIALVLADPPDVVLMDLTMPDMNGINATRLLIERLPALVVLVLTMAEDDAAVVAALAAGARGYIVKGSTSEQIVRAIRSAADGQAVFSWSDRQPAPRVLRRTASTNRRGRPISLCDTYAARVGNP